MALSDFSTVTITAEGPALTQVGFGTLLCAAYHTHNTDRVREYTDLSQLVDDGFTTKETGYRMVQAAFAQKPRPPKVKLGRLALPYTQVVKFAPVAADNLELYTLTAELDASGPVVINYTSDGSATIAEIVAGLAAAAEGSSIGGSIVAAAADGNTTISITANVGKLVFYSNWSSNLTFADLTPDPGIGTDLDAIRTADADWYGLAVDCNSPAIITAAALWSESQLVAFEANTSETTVLNNTGGNFAAALKALTYGRTALYFSLTTTGDYSGARAFAERGTHDPGAKGAGGTYAFKVLTGRPADPLTPTQKAHLRANNVVPYITTAGRNHTLDGKVIGGEFQDKIRFLDWFTIRTQERIAADELNNDIIPYDDRGIAILLGSVTAQLADGVAAEGIVSGTESASAPLAANVSSQDKAARTLNNVVFGFELAGAIHLTNITGAVTN
jgi:hypothetical protein